MNNDTVPLRNRRGSSPPFQEADPAADEKVGASMKVGRAPSDEVRLQQARDDETRWQDDGGESGEVV